MKKTFAAAAMSSVLVLGLAGVAAAAEATTTPAVAAGSTAITLDGNVRERGMYDKRDAAQDAPGHSAYDTRVQLGVKAKVSPAATGYVQLESNTGNSDVYTWGGGGAAQTGASGLMDGGNKQGDLQILQAWVDYKPADFGIKAGHMPLYLGNKVFFDHTGSGDDAIVAYGDLNGGATHIGALTIKFNEQTTNDGSDDLDGYVALITHKVNDSLKLGANYTYLRGGAADNTAELMTGLSFSNVGLTADGAIGAISYLADVELQFGDLYDDGTTTADASGWAMKLAGNYDLGGGKVGLLFGYGSGDDDATDNDEDYFVNFLTDTTYDTIIAGFRSAIPGAQWCNAAGKNSGLSNLTLFQLNGSTKVVCPLTGKDLNLFASASYMQLSEDYNNYGTNMVDEIGTELDLIATWSLTPGLSYRVEAGYLFTGDAYETAATGAGSDPDDLMFLRHSLDLKF